MGGHSGLGRTLGWAAGFGSGAIVALVCLSGCGVPAEGVTDFTLGAETASASIGPAGGALTVEGEHGPITLVVPEGALLEETVIRATLIESFDLDGFLTGVHFEPEGLVFHAPAEVRLPTGDWAFGYEGAGLDAHLITSRTEAGQLVVQTAHFSGFGAGSGGQPATAPSAAEARAQDAAARGDRDEALVALRQVFAATRPILQSGRDSRAALTTAIDAFVRVRALAQSLGLSDRVGAEIDDAVALLRAALIAERDRIFDAAVSTGRWQELLDLETFLLPRLQLLGFREDPELSAAAIAAAMPLTLALSDVALVFSDTDGLGHVVGTSHAILEGHGPVTDEPMDVVADVLGSRIGSLTGRTDEGRFDLPFTADREEVRAIVHVSFSGLEIVTSTRMETVRAPNTLPLRVVATLSRSAIAVGSGANLVVSVFRGAGPLGLAGAVTLSVTPATCSLGATGGVPDADGDVRSTVSCSEDAEASIAVEVLHRGEVATTTAILRVGDPSRRTIRFSGTFRATHDEGDVHGVYEITGSFEVVIDGDSWTLTPDIRGGAITEQSGEVRPSCENFSFSTLDATTFVSATTGTSGSLPLSGSHGAELTLGGVSSTSSRDDATPGCLVRSNSDMIETSFNLILTLGPGGGRLVGTIERFGRVMSAGELG